MKIIRSPHQFQQEMDRLRREGKTLGFVPTMGALHEGHLSLIRKARKENRVVAVSIFVNPLQFGSAEDFRRYPRNLAKDRRLLEREGVDYLFLPSAQAFYPRGYETFAEVTRMSRGLCGRFRPGHFRGVATVVTKLFNLAKPHRAYFGAKDYQQAQIIRRLVRDLNFDIEVKVLPLIRDRQGLALSSRNASLSVSERKQALSIPGALAWVRREIGSGNRNLTELRRGVFERLKRGLRSIDYVEFVDPETLEPVKSIRRRFVIAVAGWAGKTRLIDNVIIRA